jgi:glucokinase
LLQDTRFLAAFGDKGRLSPILRRMPVHVVTARAALIGTARYGLAAFSAG